MVDELERKYDVKIQTTEDKVKFPDELKAELKAQGIGNIVSGLLGGLPMTSVVVRSSANINSGGRTKLATIFHGMLLIVFALAIPFILNKIPLSALAAILLMVGYKLAKPSVFIHLWKNGYTQFIPFLINFCSKINHAYLRKTIHPLNLMLGVFPSPIRLICDSYHIIFIAPSIAFTPVFLISVLKFNRLSFNISFPILGNTANGRAIPIISN